MNIPSTGISSLAELGVTASAAEVNYVDGVTSAIQTQLDSLSTDIGAEEFLRASQDILLQLNIDGKQPLDSDLTTWAATTPPSSYAVGDLLYASAENTLSKLADVAVASYLRSGGVTTAPLWSTLKLPNSATANRIPYATSTNTWGESANLAFNGTSLIVGTGLYLTNIGGTEGGSIACGSGNGHLLFANGGVIVATFGNGGSLYGTVGVVFNEGGVDNNFRVESDTDANCFFIEGTGNGSVNVGTATEDASAKFQIASTTKGFLPPRQTTAQFAAISSKAEGLQAWDTDLHCPTAYDGTRVVLIPTVLVGSATLNFTGAAVEDLTITVTGAAVGDRVVLGVPATAFSDDTSILFFAGVSATNTVTVRIWNPESQDPTSGTFSVSVHKAG